MDTHKRIHTTRKCTQRYRDAATPTATPLPKPFQALPNERDSTAVQMSALQCSALHMYVQVCVLVRISCFPQIELNFCLRCGLLIRRTFENVASVFSASTSYVHSLPILYLIGYQILDTGAFLNSSSCPPFKYLL